MSHLFLDCRRQIDAVDDALFELLKHRAELVAELYAIKKEHQAALRDRSRETEIITRIKNKNDSLLKDDDLILIFRSIFKACLNLQKRLD